MRRTTTALAVGASALALPAAGSAIAQPAAPRATAATGAQALVPTAHRQIRLAAVRRANRYDRAQNRLVRHAVRLRHRVAHLRDADHPARTVRRFRARVEDDAPVRLRARVRTLRERLHDARAEAAAASSTATASAATASASPTLEAIAACESGGNPAASTGNGFYGKYQFTPETWASVGGTGNPAAASEAEQDQRAAMLYAREGAAPWPVCGR
jgi:Transglycosylase-like domain